MPCISVQLAWQDVDTRLTLCLTEGLNIILLKSGRHHGLEVLAAIL